MVRPVRVFTAGLKDIGAGIGSAFSSLRVRILLAVTASLIGIASVFYHWAEGWSWLDSFYFSVITISTVGYGDFSPQTAIGKLFTSVYVLCGLGIFVTTATAIGDSIASRARIHEDEL
ncbi:MAG: potassium channel family protein [Paracoccus sp. (in: a-proteobacteria)]